MIIRTVQQEDLQQLVLIENACFTPEEAATKEAFEERINRIADSFFVAEEKGVVIGLVNGPVIDVPFITDDLFEHIVGNPTHGGHQTILGLAVLPQHQKGGIAKQLLAHLEGQAMQKLRETVTLTCHEKLIPFYEGLGYSNQGQSKSTHGNVTWFNMTKNLSK